MHLIENMEKLDLKDRKILYELDIDSRQSFRSIGRKVGLSKDVVASRVKKLQEKGIIKNFITEVNNYKTGYSGVKFFLTFQNVTPKIKQEIIDYLVNNPNISEVHSVEGAYDLCVISYVENVPKFNNIWRDFINKYKDFFSNQIFCVESLIVNYKKTFLLDEKTGEKKDRILFVESSNDKKVEMDSLDISILKLLVPNSRIPTLEIANKLNSTVKTINSRIKKLVKTGVFVIYTIEIDYQKIGYQWFIVDIVLKNPEKTQKIVEYIENNPNLLYRVNSLGYVDLELVFVLNNANQLHEIIENLSSKFPDAIRNYKYSSTLKSDFGGFILKTY